MSKNIASVTLCSMIKHKWYLSFRTFNSWKQLMYIRIEFISILHVILFSYFYVTCELDSFCSFNQEAIKLLTQLVTATGWKTIFKHLHRMKSHLFHEWWLNGHWMVTGKVDFSSISVTIQLPFSRLNGRHISVTFQSAYFLKNKIAHDADSTRDVRIIRTAR